jgi:2-hydroxychromene-2-carboxylate isomerase
MRKKLRVYTDYKSPYAFVANRALFSLEASHNVEIEWLPYSLRIDEYLGTVEDRTAHDWRKVKYAYMDARRSANRQGLTLKGPKRIYVGYYSSVGMLFAQKHGFFRTYHELVFEMFWSHHLDVDELSEMRAVIERLGGSADEYEAYAHGAGKEEHDRIIQEAEAMGVFGVPFMIFEGEKFFGGDRIDLLKEYLEAASTVISNSVQEVA